jgi:glycosyltransferase involved in cell wall biosynthesis
MDNSKRKIYILTNFGQYLKSYSPIIVVSSQVNMFKRAGYEPVLIATESWNPPEESIFAGVETKRIPNVVIDGTTVDQAFEDDVDMLYDHLDKIIEDESVVFTHDLIFLPDYVKHNVACRRIAEERPSIQWIHLIHSATAPGSLIKERAMFGEKYEELLNSKFPNSIIMYPNAYDIPRVAANYSYEENEIVEVPHATDPVEGMSRIVKRLYDELSLGDPEVLVLYPLRLDRGKYAEADVYLMAGCKLNNMTSHVIFCDFQSTGGDKVTYREDLKRLAKELEVEDRVTFLSEFDEAASMEVPHEVILELFTLSNVFLLPSKSETYSLIAQEAMLRGNLCLLNHDFAPFRQIYGKNALYKQFSGANIAINGEDGEITTTHSNINEYYRTMASNIKYYLENEKVIRAKTWVRTKRNPDHIFHNYIEPLLNMEQPSADVQRDDSRI